MSETFDVYTKRTLIYKIISCIVICFLILVLACVFFSGYVSKFPYQPLVVILFLIGFLVTLSSIFSFPSIKTYKKNGQLIITDSTISTFDRTYFLSELTAVEISAGDFNGKGSRGGYSDGSGNKILVTTKDHFIIEAKFVITSKEQQNKLTQIMKYWRSEGFKIISNGIDLV